MRNRLVVAIAAGACLLACTEDEEPADAAQDADVPGFVDGETTQPPDDAARETPDAEDPDVGGDTTPPADAPDATDPPPSLEVVPTIAQAAPDPLAGTAVTSCPIYADERCEGGALQRCSIYDTGAAGFDDSPDPLLKRVYLYDRWYDRYSSPDGQTAERVYPGGMAVDAPESTWAAPEAFGHYSGRGDSAIWTGAALSAAIFRYAQTGTSADYERMVQKTRALLLKFDVTGITGYLARYHFLWMPAGAPQTDQHMFRHEGQGTLGTRDRPFDASKVGGVPEVYIDGYTAPDGTVWKGTPMWNGHPSIDQYTGPMMTFPIVYGLLDDDLLKARIAAHMTCYLKRLRRLEIINLQSNTDLLDALTAYLGGGGLRLDPGDIDLTKVDRIVAYYHAGINEANAETFDGSCPEKVALEPEKVIDAASPLFLIETAEVVLGLNETDTPSSGQIDHMYVPTLRGGDASHLLHLAAMAYYFTGEEQYRDFLLDELVTELQAPQVALTMQAFRAPDFCNSFFGDHITFGTHWQLTTMLGDSPLRDTLIQATEEELWQKALHNHSNTKFDVMYASTVPEGIATGRAAAIQRVATTLSDFGGKGPTKDAPRRTYTNPAADVLAALPAGVTLRCPTEQERTQCEQDIEVMGLSVPGEKITFECTGAPNECVLEDGTCARGIASEGLPPSLRNYSDFMWQRSPFAIGEQHGQQGGRQSPGRDLSEAYWMARHYGYVSSDGGSVLAWQTIGVCP